MALSTPSPEQERRFSEAITNICALLKKNEASNVLHNTLYLHQDRTWSWRFESSGADLGHASLDRIMLEFACFQMGGFNLDLVCIKDQETFDELWSDLLARMEETANELAPIPSP